MSDGIFALDLVAFVTFLWAGLASFRISREVAGRSTRAFLQAAIACFVLIEGSNLADGLFHLSRLDVYENYLALLYPQFFLFFVYTSMLRRERHIGLLERKELESQVHEMRELFKVFMEQLPGHAFIKDRDGKYIYVNEQMKRRFSDVTDWRMEELVSQPEELAVIREHDRTAMARGRWTGIEPLTGPDGVSHRYQVAKFRIGEKLIGGIAVDVTDQLAMADAQRRLQEIVDQAPMTVMVTDPDGTITYVNAHFSRATGYPTEAAIGNNPRILKSGQQDAAFYRELWETITSGRVWEGEFVNRKKDGNHYREEATIFPFLDEQGAIQGFAKLAYDVTRERELEDMVLHSQKMETVGRLAAGVAHDFNNILTAMMGYAEMAMSEAASERQRDHLDRVLQSGNRARQLTSRLLGFARKQATEKKLVDPAQFIRDYEKTARRLVREDIDLQVHAPDTVPAIMADPTQLEQVIMNLVVNAGDAVLARTTPGEKRIRISIDTSEVWDEQLRVRLDLSTGRYVVFEVSDTGVGIPLEIQEQIFDPFFTTKKRGEGTGLGLSTVYGIAKQNEGAVHVYSEPGSGTTFRVYWPVYEGAPEADATGADRVAGTGMKATRPATILLVEDAMDVRDIAEEVLTEAGHTVQSFETAEQALRAIQSGRDIDLLFTDIILPGMDGLALAKAARSIRPGMPVLFASGYREDGTKVSEIPAPSHFLMKPYGALDLVQAVEQVLADAGPTA